MESSRGLNSSNDCPMHKYPCIKILLLMLGLLPLAGCLRTYHPAQLRTSTADLKEASLQQLVDSINGNAARWQRLQALVGTYASFPERRNGRLAAWPQ